MLGNLLKFELQLQSRQVGFWITILVMALFGFLLASTDFISISLEGGSKVKNNGAIPLALNISVLSLFSIFFAAVFVVTGVMRDDTFKSMEIVHSTPVQTRDMILSRLIGVWIATTLCISAAVLGMLFGEFAPWADKETFGPMNPLYYLQPIFVYVIINALFVSGIFTAIATITRNKSLVYVSAVGLFVLYMGAGLIAGEDAPDMVSSLIDPFGSSALAVTTEFWPADEQNTQMSPLLGYIGINRLFWGGIGLAFFILSFLLSKRGLVMRKTKRGIEKFAAHNEKIDLRPVTPDHGFSNSLTAFKTRFSYEYLTTVRSVPFLILVGIALALFGITVYVALFMAPDRILPTSRLIANATLGSLSIPMIIIMVFFGGDIMWRDRVAGINEILDATPVKNPVLLSAKWIALSAVVFTLIGIGMLFGMITQIALGGSEVPIIPSTFLKIGFIGFGFLFLFQTLLVMFVQNFAPNRVVGMLGAAGVLAALVFALPQLPFFHPLMAYGQVSAGSLSEMSGFSNMLPFKWFTTYWGALTLFFAILSIWMWRRGLQTGLISRLKKMPSNITPITGGLAALALAVFAGTGGIIYKAYNIDGEYLSPKAQEKLSVKYEKLAKPLIEEITLPKVTAVEADISFRPSKRDAVVKGLFRMENASETPIETLYVSEPTDNVEDIRELSVSGAVLVKDTELAKDLSKFDYRIYKFEPPLAQGDKSVLKFETYYNPPKLADSSSINRNGTFVNNFATMPTLGLNDSGFLDNPDKRRKYDLPKKERKPERDNEEARQRHFISSSSDYVDFKASVCTDPDQIPIAPGKLIKTYEKNGQACRDYKATNPILNFFSFLSADYAVAEDIWNNPNGENVDLRIFYHPKHDFNIELMMKAMKSSFDTFTTTFGPYQYSQLRIMEFPYASFAQAFAGTVPFSENIGFVRDPGNPDDNESIDLATYVTMHEIGHQWFAHQIVPANTKGFNVLSEGLTENAAMTAYEKELGWQKARRLLEKRAIESYLIMRTVDKDDEPPLALAEQQQYLDYNKASWVFWGLKQYMGEEKMQGAIRGFLDEYGSKGAPYPTTKELTDYLREAAGPDYDQLITDYWDRITFWELKFEEDDGKDVKITSNANGTFKVDMTINVDKRVASEESGKERSVTGKDDKPAKEAKADAPKLPVEQLNEWVEIGFYDKDPKETLGDEWIALERVKITELETALSFDVKSRPTHILLDPRRLLIERNVKDNVKELEKKLASAE